MKLFYKTQTGRNVRTCAVLLCATVLTTKAVQAREDLSEPNFRGGGIFGTRYGR